MQPDDRQDLHARFLSLLARRKLLLPDGETTIYGLPAWREVPPSHKPQALQDANNTQNHLVTCAFATPATGPDKCALWVENVFAVLGIDLVGDSASTLYERFCPFTDTSQLLVGMIVATSVHPYGLGGAGYGHVGLYIGDGEVLDCAQGSVRRAPLDLWLSTYGIAAEPRWGWLGGLPLA